MNDDIYRKLQVQLDGYSVGFPATESGIELKILRSYFSEADAEMFTNLTLEFETASEIAQRIERPTEEVVAHLKDMESRGLIFSDSTGDAKKYSAVPYVHGISEFNMKQLDRPSVKKIIQYWVEGFGAAMAKAGPGFLRTIPIQQSVDATRHVAPYDDVCDLLKSAETIAVTDCNCRTGSTIRQRGCEKPVDVCFMLDAMARYYIDNKLGRRVDVDEAIAIMTKAHEAGLVPQPSTSQRPEILCNCCADCCGPLLGLKLHPKPATVVFSNYQAAIDPDDCTGCETCLERCQMEAVRMTDDDLAQIDTDRCIGCGLCVTTCPTEAIQLVLKPEEQRRTPPVDTEDQRVYLQKIRQE